MVLNRAKLDKIGLSKFKGQNWTQMNKMAKKCFKSILMSYVKLSGEMS